MLKQNIFVSLIFIVLLVVSLTFVHGVDNEQQADVETNEETKEETKEEAEEETKEDSREVNTGTAEGHGGDITVEVVTENGEISDLEVVEHSETEDIAEPAFEELIAAVKEEQSAEVDTVSGATVTSEAFIEAVEKALDQQKTGTESNEESQKVNTGTAEGHGGDITVEVV
ncbi:MAG: FMN-binding protein, partial [Bacillota bacterium]